MRNAWGDFHKETGKTNAMARGEEALLKKQAKSYAENASIHGFAYIAESGRPTSERLCWLLVCASAFVLSVLLMWPIYVKWRDSPTYTTLNTTNYPVWNMPFPGVTICSNIMVHTDALKREIEKTNEEYWTKVADDFEETYPEEDFETELKFAMAVLAKKASGHIGLDDAEVQVRNVTVALINTFKDQISSLMRKVSHRCGFMLLACYWQGRKVDCSEYFETSTSDVGYCCSFNTVKLANQIEGDFDGKDSDFEEDFFYDYLDDFDFETTSGAEEGEGSDETTTEAPPIETTSSKPQSTETKGGGHLHVVRSNSASSSLGLTVLLDIDRPFYWANEDFLANDFEGHKVLVHSPFDFPEAGSKGFSVPGGSVAYIGVGAQRTSSTDKVKAMSIKRRNCIRHDEDKAAMREAGVRMDIFQNYSRQACILECRARSIMDTCGCLPYYYPDFSSTFNDTSCDFEGLKCIFERPGILRALNTGGESDNFFSDGVDCYCPLECEENTYQPEMSQAPLRENATAVRKKMEFDNDFKRAKFAKAFYQAKAAEHNKTLEELQSLLACAKGESSACINDTQPSDLDQEEIREEIIDEEDLLNRSLTQAYEWEEEYYAMSFDAPKDVSLVHIYFKELGVIEYVRDELYSAVDFIAAVGGLIGLCSGFSIISIVEFLYWFTLRGWNDRKRKQQRPKNQT